MLCLLLSEPPLRPAGTARRLRPHPAAKVDAPPPPFSSPPSRLPFLNTPNPLCRISHCPLSRRHQLRTAATATTSPSSFLFTPRATLPLSLPSSPLADQGSRTPEKSSEGPGRPSLPFFQPGPLLRSARLIRTESLCCCSSLRPRSSPSLLVPAATMSAVSAPPPQLRLRLPVTLAVCPPLPSSSS